MDHSTQNTYLLFSSALVLLKTLFFTRSWSLHCHTHAPLKQARAGNSHSCQRLLQRQISGTAHGLAECNWLCLFSALD